MSFNFSTIISTHYLLDKGVGWFHIEDSKFEVKPGDLVFYPEGVQHGFLMSIKRVILSTYGPPFDRKYLNNVSFLANIRWKTKGRDLSKEDFAARNILFWFLVLPLNVTFNSEFER